MFGSDISHYKSIKRPLTEQDVTIGTYNSEYGFY